MLEVIIYKFSGYWWYLKASIKVNIRSPRKKKAVGYGIRNSNISVGLRKVNLQNRLSSKKVKNKKK